MFMHAPCVRPIPVLPSYWRAINTSFLENYNLFIWYLGGEVGRATWVWPGRMDGKSKLMFMLSVLCLAHIMRREKRKWYRIRHSGITFGGRMQMVAGIKL